MSDDDDDFYATCDLTTTASAPKGEVHALPPAREISLGECLLAGGAGWGVCGEKRMAETAALGALTPPSGEKRQAMEDKTPLYPSGRGSKEDGDLAREHGAATAHAGRATTH